MRAVLAGIGVLCGAWALAEAEGTLVSYPAEYRQVGSRQEHFGQPEERRLRG